MHKIKLMLLLCLGPFTLLVVSSKRFKTLANQIWFTGPELKLKSYHHSLSLSLFVSLPPPSVAATDYEFRVGGGN